MVYPDHRSGTRCSKCESVACGADDKFFFATACIYKAELDDASTSYTDKMVSRVDIATSVTIDGSLSDSEGMSLSICASMVVIY